MPNILWEVSDAKRHYVLKVSTNTRSNAIALAEATFLKDHFWETDMVRKYREDYNDVYTRTPVPDFRAEKIGRA